MPLGCEAGVEGVGMLVGWAPNMPLVWIPGREGWPKAAGPLDALEGAVLLLLRREG